MVFFVDTFLSVYIQYISTILFFLLCEKNFNLFGRGSNSNCSVIITFRRTIKAKSLNENNNKDKSTN